jgi:hypothetical protein
MSLLLIGMILCSEKKKGYLLVIPSFLETNYNKKYGEQLIEHPEMGTS